jgi:hypothetical protein
MIEFLFDTTLSIPVVQLLLLMYISTLSLLFGKVRLALLVNFIFTFYWAYFFNRDLLWGLGPEKFEYFTIIYFMFGLIILLGAAFSFMFQKQID